MAKDKLLYDDIIDKSVKEGIDALKKSMNELYESFKKLTEQSVKNSTSTKDAASSTKKLSDEQRRINEEEKRAEKIARDLKNTREKLNKSYIAAQEQVRKRRAAILEEIRAENQASDSLAKKEALLRKLTQQYRNASSVVARQMAPEIKKLKTEINNLNGAIGNNTGRVGSYFKSFVQGAASMATMYVSFQGFTRLISSTFGIMTSFEKTMSGVAAISGATGTELQKLEEDAKRLGATTSKTATEVAQLQVEYAKLGFTTQEILNATEATVLLSQATREDLARSAEVAGATIRGFGMDASESSRVVDVMAASFTSSALNLERFAEAMKYVAPVAKASGITLEQTAAMMSKLADAGIHGSMAGTALRQIMLEMAKAGKTGMQGFNEMAKAGLSLADANDEVGQRAATALLILSENEKAVNNLTESYNNAEGAAKKMADTQMDNLSGSITILSSAWEGLVLKITSGDGALKRFVDTVSSFVQWLSGANYKMKEYNFNQNVLEQATRKYNDVLAKETNEIDLLFRMLKQTNPESKKRIDLVSEIQKKYPDYISNIDLEKAGVEGLALAQKDYNDQIERKMIIAAKEEATNELLKESNRYIKQRYEAEIQLIKIEARRQQIYGDGTKIITEAESKELEFMKSNEDVLNSIILGSASAINDYKNQMAEIEKYYSDFIKTSSNANGIVTSGSKKLTKDEAEEHIKRIEQQRDFRTSELKLWGAGQSAIFASEQRFNEEILELRKKYGLLNEIEYKTQANNLAIARKRQHQKELEETQAMFNEMILSLPENESANEDFSFFESPVSFKERFEEYKDVYREAGQSVVDITREHYEEMREIADMEKQLADDKVNNARDYFNQQQNLAAQGFQNNMAQAEKELLLAKQTQAKAEREQRKALRNQQILQSIEQGANLLTASTSIYNTAKGNPLLYVPLLATMWGSFFVQKAKSIKATRYGKGGMFDIGGGSHESGNDTSLGVHGGIERIVEGGEKVFVVNKTSSKKYRNMLPNLVDSINKGNLSVKADSRGNIVNISTEKMERGLDRIAKNTSTITYTKNGKTIIKQGLNTIEYV